MAGSFIYGIWFMDGCGPDFKCAAFFLFLAAVAIMRMILRICHFASCHGKTDEGDAEGPAFKELVPNRQFSNERPHDSGVAVVADAREREHRSEPSDPDFFERGSGTGVYRYFYHFIGMRGLWKIDRRFPQAQDGANILLAGTSRQFQIHNIHSTITSGFPGVLHCATRCCFSCSKCKVGKYLECEKSKAHIEEKVHFQAGQCSNGIYEVNVMAKTTAAAYSSRQITDVARGVFASALVGDVVAAETESDTEPFWLVRVMKVVKKLSSNKVSQIGEVVINCKKGEPALEVMKLFYSRDEAISTFCDDTQRRLVHIPQRLLRVGKIQLEKKETTKGTGSRNSRAPVSGDGTSEMPDHYYALGNTTRQDINLKCRCEDSGML